MLQMFLMVLIFMYLRPKSTARYKPSTEQFKLFDKTKYNEIGIKASVSFFISQIWTVFAKL